MSQEHLVRRIIYTSYRYGHKRHVWLIKNEIDALGYNTRHIQKHWSVHQFLQRLPRPQLVKIANKLEGSA